MSKRRRRQTLPTEEFTAAVTGLSHEGRGIAHLNGKATFLFGALPGEQVRFRYTKQRNRLDEGDTTQVITASAQRTTPKCAHFGVCGGCSLQHMRHEFQIEYKQHAFLEQLNHQAGIVPEKILPAITGDIWGYRRKARIGIKHVPKKEKVLVGFRERNGRFIADLLRCEVLHPSVGEHIQALSDFLWQLEAKDKLPQLEIAVDDHTTAVILRHLEPLPAADLKKWEQFCQQHHWQLYLQSAGPDSITLHYPANADPILTYTLAHYQLQLHFKPQQFTQVNASINEQMIQRAIDLLDLKPNDRVLDLFCGIGNFSLPIAKHCAQVVGIEGENDAVTQAKSNAQLNGLGNCEFYCADLFQTTYNADWSKHQYTKILLDPPSAGAQEIAANIGQWQPERIVYVSCNPATLARDAAILKDQGYRLRCAGILDMFPHTQHVEAISLFEKA